jgi:hypothetical protein
MERLDALEAARRILNVRFPDARAAFLTGSALTSRITPTSDLDIVVVLKGSPAPFRETIREYGWLIELFVQTRESIKYFSELEIADHHATTLRMIASGKILISLEAEAESVQAAAIDRLKKGPLAISVEEMRRRRYALTDQLDDFIGATDPIELLFIGQQLVVGTSELALLSKSQWLASGKWLPRYLAENDPELALQLYRAIESVISHGEKRLMEIAVLEILERVGGPLAAGYRAAGEIPG